MTDDPGNLMPKRPAEEEPKGYTKPGTGHPRHEPAANNDRRPDATPSIALVIGLGIGFVLAIVVAWWMS